MSARTNRLVAAQVVLLLLVVSVGAASSDAEDWEPLALFGALLFLATVGELFSVKAGQVHLGPAFLATALAMALLGPAPAATIAVLAVIPSMVQQKTKPDLALNNVLALATYPLAGGLVIEAFHGPEPPAEADLVFALIVFAVYLPTNLLNFLLVVGYLSLRDGQSFREKFARLYVPVLPWEIATAVLTAGAVLAYQEMGIGAIAVLTILLLAQHSLLRAVLDAERQRDVVVDQMSELVELQRGVVRVMVETLSMRDRMTARHSAAVARFARALAQAAGRSEREQELVRIAGLLHDVGKFTFPDRTLTKKVLTEEDWVLVRSHPQRGADIVRRVRGYAEVADIILCHHERMDGTGYPRGIPGEKVPILARMISIADTFDVMTSRDSYRTPVTPEEAVRELRRVGGAQLDAELVELFVSVLEAGRVGFTHADDADLEEELTYERRVQSEKGTRRFRRGPAPATTT